MGQFKVCLFYTRQFEKPTVEPPEDVKKAFKKYAGGEYMTTEELRRFLVEEQGEAEATVDANGIMRNIIEKCKKTGDKIDIDDFHFYLFSTDLNPPLDTKVDDEYMKLPLSHYFIYTGHNSYLTGNQLTSRCSDKPIEKALKNGVRVIELDLWPGYTKNHVRVVHGGTMTFPVGLKKCLESIKAHAFVASKYPVIITLEDHLTPYLHKKVAKMIKETFGEMIYRLENSKGSKNEFASPEELKERIIISTKPPSKTESSSVKDKRKNTKKGTNFDEEIMGIDQEELKQSLTGTKTPNKFSKAEYVKEKLKSLKKGNSFDEDIWVADQEEDDDSNEQYQDDVDDCDSDEEPKCLCLKTSRNRRDYNQNFEENDEEYRSLISIPSGKPKGQSLKDALKVEDDDVMRRLSLNEADVKKVAKFHVKDTVRFTQKNILRVYPKGTRFDSSNYNPLVSWMLGAQMVAFNMQGYDRFLWLMQGMFRAYGGHGYVKKPDFLMNKDMNADLQRCSIVQQNYVLRKV